MPTFTGYPGSEYNVIGSFNDFFETQLTAKGTPAFMASAVINYDFPVKPLTFPSFSVTHLGAEQSQTFQGRGVDNGWRGDEKVGIAEIDCWESYNRASGNHIRNIRVMRDMVSRVFATGAAFQILDVYGSTASPTGNGTLIRCETVTNQSVTPDPNPDIIRSRLLVNYRWLERVSAG